tara:strand:- start:677 stop:964 length:288 start_codon:yes stop_codon:yes gene_type:complete
MHHSVLLDCLSKFLYLRDWAILTSVRVQRIEATPFAAKAFEGGAPRRLYLQLGQPKERATVPPKGVIRVGGRGVGKRGAEEDATVRHVSAKQLFL